MGKPVQRLSCILFSFLLLTGCESTPETISLVETGTLSQVEAHFAEGANVNQHFGERNETPLLTAARTGRTDVVERLIARGANLEARDCFGYTPLMSAAEQGHLDVVRLLLEKGSNAEASAGTAMPPCQNPDPHGTALTISAAGNHASIVSILLKHGASSGVQRALYLALSKPNGNGQLAVAAIQSAGFQPTSETIRQAEEARRKTAERQAEEDRYNVVDMVLDLPI